MNQMIEWSNRKTVIKFTSSKFNNYVKSVVVLVIRENKDFCIFCFIADLSLEIIQ